MGCMKLKIGYIKEVVKGGRIGRIYPANEVQRCGYKAEIEDKKREE